MHTSPLYLLSIRSLSLCRAPDRQIRSWWKWWNKSKPHRARASSPIEQRVRHPWRCTRPGPQEWQWSVHVEFLHYPTGRERKRTSASRSERISNSRRPAQSFGEFHQVHSFSTVHGISVDRRSWLFSNNQRWRRRPTDHPCKLNTWTSVGYRSWRRSTRYKQETLVDWFYSDSRTRSILWKECVISILPLWQFCLRLFWEWCFHSQSSWSLSLNRA